MPRLILARYILREHIAPFLFAFFVITLIFLLNLLFRELSRILSKGLPWGVVVEFFALNMAWIIALSVPMAVLTATLMAFGRLSADNEITAMEAGGISIYHFVAPVLIAAAVLAAGLIWFNNHVLPDFNHRTRLLASDIARKRPAISIEPGVWFDDIPNYGLLVQEIEDSAGITRARNLLINDYSDKNLSRSISARRGYIELSRRKGALVFTLFDGEMQEIDLKKPEEFRRVSFPKYVIAITVDDMFLRRSESEYRGDREKSAQQMRREIERYRSQILDRRNAINEALVRSVNGNLREVFGQHLDLEVLFEDSIKTASDSKAIPETNGLVAPARSAAGGMAKPAAGVRTGTSDRRRALSHILFSHRRAQSRIKREASTIRSYERKTKSLSVEIQKKYSIPVACIVFVLIGAPLGVMARRGGLATGGGVSLVFFLLYWTCLVGGEDLADRQIISPFLAMWSANIIVGIADISASTCGPGTYHHKSRRAGQDLSWAWSRSTTGKGLA